MSNLATTLVNVLGAADAVKQAVRLLEGASALDESARKALDQLERAGREVDAAAHKAVSVLTASADLDALRQGLADQRAETLSEAERRWGPRK